MTNINYHCDGCNNGIVVMQKHEDNNKGSVKLTSNPCNGCKKDFKLSEASKLSKVSFASSTAEATALKERVLELEECLREVSAQLELKQGFESSLSLEAKSLINKSK